MKISLLHEEFIDKARRPMDFGRLPLMPSEGEAPLIPVSKWTKTRGTLVKAFQFRLGSQRNDFVKQVLDHEEEVGHHSLMQVAEGEVIVTLSTHGVDVVTELDKEFARWLDELFRDVVYNTPHE